jgi:hypothetical protein
MKPENQSGKSGKQKEKKQKGCYWNWLVETEIKTFEAWNKDRKK